MRNILKYTFIFLLILTGCTKKVNKSEEEYDINNILEDKNISFSTNYSEYEDEDNCFENVYEIIKLDDEESGKIIHKDGTICLYNIKPFRENDKNTLAIDKKIDSNILAIYLSKIYLKDGSTISLFDDNYLIQELNDYYEIKYYSIMNKYEKCFQRTNYKMFYCINNNNKIYQIPNESIIEEYDINIELDDDETIEYFYGDVLKTNKRYYIKIIENKEDYEKYNNVEPIYKFVQFIKDDYYNNIKYINNRMLYIEYNGKIRRYDFYY